MLKWLAALLFGAGACTVLDHEHVAWGVLAYPHPDVWQQAWWVPLLFFTGTLAALTSTGVVRRLVGGEPGPTRPVQALMDVAGFAGAYYLTAVGHHAPDVITAILAGTWLIRAVSGLSGWAVAFCIGTALVGPAVEGALSALGGFHYLHPDFLGVTRWLPALYLHVGVVGVAISGFLQAPTPIEIDVAV